MPYVFDCLNLIQKLLSRSPLGLITDVDGTISEIAPTPQGARVSPLCRRYLAILRDHLAVVAAISGRPARQVRDMIRIDGLVYIGNYGLERWVVSQTELANSVRDYVKIVRALVEELTPLLNMDGVSIENKGVTLTIHYRLTPEPQVAEREILNAVATLPQARGLRIIEGKKAVNLLPPVDINKGTATTNLIHEYSLRGGLYLGDDATDIDGFRAIHEASTSPDFTGITIGIISSEMPEGLARESDLTLNGVADVERFLGWLSQSVLRPG